MSDSGPLIVQVIHASKWSALGEMAAKAVSPLVFIVLARLLTPEDFGVVAVAVIAVNFSEVFWDAGLNKALVQRQGDLQKAANVVFWTNAVLGIFIYLTLFALSHPIAYLFEDSRVAPVLQVLGLQMVFSSLSAVHTTLLQKNLNFKRLFHIRLWTVGVPGMASIPLAYFGMGYWALVIGSLGGAIFQLLVLWLLSSWRPQLEFDKAVARELLSFGAWASANGLLAWFFAWADSLVIGIYLTAHDLGLFRTGSALVDEVFTLLIVPVSPVLFSAFSRITSDFVRLRKALIKANKFITMIMLPAGFGLFAVREPLAELIFGSHWQGVGIVIGTMGLLHGISWIIGANTEAYLAIGRPDLDTKIMLMTSWPYLLVYLMTVQFGLGVFLWAKFITMFVTLPVHFLFAKKYLKLTSLDYLHSLYKIIIAALIMFACSIVLIDLLTDNTSSAFIGLLLTILCSIVIYSMFLYFLEKEQITEILSFLVKRKTSVQGC